MSELANLQTILKRFYNREGVAPHQRKVCGSLLACRTEVLGGLQQQCNRCGYQQPQYRSCRDRHCPQCQGRASYRWSEQQQANILPVNYYHLVFTLPHRLNGWIARAPKVMYRILFAASWETLRTFGADPKRLGGLMGMTAVLHTWGQQLNRHVHLHCLVPGGALIEGQQWKGTQSHYLFPVKALSTYFKGTLVRRLRHACMEGDLASKVKFEEIKTMLDAVMGTANVVYAKACLNHTEQVVGYLARYSHRIGISNARILSVEQEQVTIRYKDYKDQGQHKQLVLPGAEFVKRYLMHILPKGFMRIRHYGYLANCCRERKIKQIRELLAVKAAERKEEISQPTEAVKTVRCPQCRQGEMQCVGEILPVKTALKRRYR